MFDIDTALAFTPFSVPSFIHDVQQKWHLSLSKRPDIILDLADVKARNDSTQPPLADHGEAVSPSYMSEFRYQNLF